MQLFVLRASIVLASIAVLYVNVSLWQVLLLRSAYDLFRMVAGL